MPDESIPKLNGEDRLRTLNHGGAAILFCDFSDCLHDEGKALLQALVQHLKQAPELSILLLIDTHNAPHDSSQANEWKRNLPIFDSRLKKCAIIGLGPLNRIALAGMRMYARLVSQEKIISQAQVFDGRDAAMDYLASEK